MRGVDEAPSYLRGVEFTDIFISHAKLYVFASQLGIESLKKKIVAYLQASLKFFPLCEERCQDIADFAHFVYRNEWIPRESKHESYDLFQLELLKYCVANREILKKNHSFMVVSGYLNFNFKEDLSTFLESEEPA